MEKRSRKNIEADVKLIKAASATATTIKQIAEMTGLSVWKISTSLESHPIIKKRVYEAVERNRTGVVPPQAKPKTRVVRVKAKKTVTICDAPALISGLSSCLEGPITIPHFVYNTLVGLGKGDKQESPNARKAIEAIDNIPGWCSVAEKVKGETLVVEPYDEEPSWRARALVALACKFWEDGYTVTVKTRTGSIANLARLQGIFDEVYFVEADNEVDSMG